MYSAPLLSAVALLGFAHTTLAAPADDTDATSLEARNGVWHFTPHMNFMRYSDASCNGTFIKEDNLKANMCKDFQRSQGFSSFQFEFTHQREKAHLLACQLFIFPDHKCEADEKAWKLQTDTLMALKNRECISNPDQIIGHSARLDCNVARKRDALPTLPAADNDAKVADNNVEAAENNIEAADKDVEVSENGSTFSLSGLKRRWDMRHSPRFTAVRFSTATCEPGSQLKLERVKANSCQTFKETEGFAAVRAFPRTNMALKGTCAVTLFSEPKCKGAGQVVDRGVVDSMGHCLASPEMAGKFNAHSMSIDCHKGKKGRSTDDNTKQGDVEKHIEARLNVHRLKVRISPYDDWSCNGTSLLRETEVKAGSCRHLKKGFFGFRPTIIDNVHKTDHEYCRAIVYSDQNCKDELYRTGDLATESGSCYLPRDDTRAHAVKVWCDHTPDPKE